MNKVHVMLVGGRQVANLLGVLLLNPDSVVLLISKDSKEDEVTNLKKALPEAVKLEFEENVEAEAYMANLEICKKLCRQNQGDQIYFNITCSHKIMAFAAFVAARQFEGTSVFYIDTAKKKIIWLWPENGEQFEEKCFNLTIDKYLEAYGRRATRKSTNKKRSFSEDKAYQAACLLAEDSDDTRKLLEQIRSVQKKDACGMRKIKINGQEALLDELKELSVVDIENSAYVVRSDEDWNFFKGEWLEFFVGNEAKKLQLNGQRIFEEVATGLEIPSGSAKKEIDVTCFYQAQMIHASCKTGRSSFKTEHLDELSAVSNLIGGRFCSRIFITNERISTLGSNEGERFLEQAKQREIVVVTGERLMSIGEILKKQAVNPDFRRM